MNYIISVSVSYANLPHRSVTVPSPPTRPDLTRLLSELSSRISELMAFTSENPLCTRWTSLRDDELTINNVQNLLTSVGDDLWVVAACVDRLVDDVEVQRTLIQIGLERTNGAVGRGKEAHTTLGVDDSGDEGEERSGSKGDQLVSYFRTVPADTQLCHVRAVLLDRLDRLNTYVEICKTLLKEDPETPGEVLDEWEDDPWAEGGGESSPKGSNVVQPPVSLSTFLIDDLLHLSCLLASRQYYSALRILFERHSSYIWPYRFTVLDSIPEYSHPSEYHDILPGLHTSTDVEQIIPSEPWRSELDWSETDEVRAAIKASEIVLGIDFPSRHFSDKIESHLEPLIAGELTTWYKTRVDHIISSTGMVDVALTTIQYGASQGVPDLDELGEELSLLARLVYDAPQADSDNDTDPEDDDWTLARWSSVEPAAIVRAYLAHSTPHTIAKDMQKLVMPYLFVLESRTERSGRPDPGLPNRLLYEYILSAPLEIAAAIFDASKPTLPVARRLIRNDEDIARLALACLYGSDSRDEWTTMSRIFECLPAWDIDRNADEEDEADTTIASLGAFVTPSTNRPQCTASDLLIFFKPLPISSLSRALDILDVHLESGEILARWNVPAPLRWFLQSSNDATEQRAWANRMSRRADGSEDQLNTREDWEWLLKDMLKLSGKGESGLRGGFGTLHRKDVMRIFLGGLLSTGSESHHLGFIHSMFPNVCLQNLTSRRISYAPQKVNFL